MLMRFRAGSLPVTYLWPAGIPSTTNASLLPFLSIFTTCAVFAAIMHCHSLILSFFRLLFCTVLSKHCRTNRCGTNLEQRIAWGRVPSCLKLWSVLWVGPDKHWPRAPSGCCQTIASPLQQNIINTICQDVTFLKLLSPPLALTLKMKNNMYISDKGYPQVKMTKYCLYLLKKKCKTIYQCVKNVFSPPNLITGNQDKSGHKTKSAYTIWCWTVKPQS